MSSNHEHAEWIVTVAIGDVALVLAVGTLFVLLARRIKQPAVIGEITAGICLGPSLLGLLPGDLPEQLFPSDVRPYLNVVAQIGLLLFMFIIGWEFDYASMRGRRKKLGTIWICAAALPLSMGMGLAVLLHGSNDVVNGKHIRMVDFALYIGIAMSIAAFPVLARIITDHRLQFTRVGTLALALAALDDILAWSMLAVVVALVTASGTGGFLSVIGWGAVYIVVMLVIVRPALAYLARKITSASAPYLAVAAAAGTLCSAYITSEIGLHAIFGAFVFGLVMPRGPQPELMHRAAMVPLENVSKLLLPLFFVVTGLSVDLTAMTSDGLIQMTLIICVAITGKLGGVLLSARVTGMSWQDSTILGLLMNTRGLTELVILNVGLSLGLLSVELFTAMVMMALVTTGMTSPILSMMLRRAAPHSEAAVPAHLKDGGDESDASAAAVPSAANGSGPVAGVENGASPVHRDEAGRNSYLPTPQGGD
ncbi:sodium:proton exchanger [Wenjunlia vitaminophila]|uniref:Membrane antiporter n=1 Tax=Wenjunlia vitaminophila TaxID=76728 RepID=A3R4P7_WENVI|nr:cation:proton antiporter [Wenjunlia vitaminophila]ABO15842.1 membrane antiporter [Wenjunlia vitaminophila]KRV49592.1 sodium:proton exchanger [Wenjunlia vitaminophila]